MTNKFIILTAATPKRSRVRVSVSHINTYQEADIDDNLRAGSAIALGHDQEANFLFVTESPQEIDVLIRNLK